MLRCSVWKDESAPTSTKILLGLVDETMELTKTKAGPILVHCSAGVGRTGCFIALYKMAEELDLDNVTELDLFNTLLEMRRQRSGMIQNHQQYHYVIKCLEQYVLNKVSKTENHQDRSGVVDKLVFEVLVDIVDSIVEEYNLTN